MEKTLPSARWQHSRDTEERLLNAALALLEEGGLDAALMPRIADKSALLRAAFLAITIESFALDQDSLRHTGEPP